jgi:hypothetical protein
MLRRDPNLIKIIELAVSEGRHFQSKKTGFIHAHEADEECRETIPILYNLYFAFALISTSSIPKVQEGKFILSRMLSFQNLSDRESRGNFPVFLHEYPICRDRLMGLECLFPLHWISIKFATILSSPLKEELERALLLLRNYIDTQLKGRTLPIWAKYLLGKKQDISLDETPENIAALIVGLEHERPSELSSIRDVICATWHPQLGRYVGPALEKYKNDQLMATLYDYFLSYFTGEIPGRLKKPSLACLQAILVQDIPLQLSFSNTVDAPSWKLFKEENFALFLAKDHRKHFLSIFAEHHTFLVELLRGKLLESHYESGKGFCIIEFDSEIFQDLDHGAEADVIQMWCEKKRTRLLVEQKKATHFSLNDQVELILPSLKIEFRFEQLLGDGIFSGSIFFQNRPQRKVDSNDRMPYDFSLSLRAVCGHTPCRLRLSFSATPFDSSSEFVP